MYCHYPYFIDGGWICIRLDCSNCTWCGYVRLCIPNTDSSIRTSIAHEWVNGMLPKILNQNLNFLKLNINMGIYSADLRPIEEGCECECCVNYTRAALHLLFRSNQSVAASILSIHNLYHQKRLMSEMRESIINGMLDI